MFDVYALCAKVLPRTYYVDQTNGNDSNSGLQQDAAFKTIAKINGLTLLPNDVVLFNRGASWQEQLTVISSGTDGSLITFAAYGTGASPVIGTVDPNGRNYITFIDIEYGFYLIDSNNDTLLDSDGNYLQVAA
jgi:hypothetical protein